MSTTTRTIPAKDGKPKITFKSNGSLRRAAGVTSDGKINEAHVRKLAAGHGGNAAKARFYLDVLKG